MYLLHFENMWKGMNPCTGSSDLDIMERAEEKKGMRGYDTERLNCLHGYKKDLKQNIPLLHQIYEGYQRNFQPHDGSLVETDFAKRPLNKQDAKFIAEIKEQEKVVTATK
mgnify:CR=1 FL=1